MAVFHRTATIAHLTSDMPLRRSLRHLMVLLLLCGVLLSGWLAYVVALRVGQAQIQATGLHRLELYTASLQREISKYAFLPGTLDLEKEVLALLAEVRLSLERESLPFDPEHAMGAYDLTKAEASLEVLKAARDGLDAVIVAPTGVIGPHDFRTSELGALIRSWLQPKTELLIDGKYDFVDVRDVVRGEILAAEKGRNGERYIISDRWVSQRELHTIAAEAVKVRPPWIGLPMKVVYAAAAASDLIGRLVGKEFEFSTVGIKMADVMSPLDHSKAERELGWTPQPVEQSIVEAAQFFRDHHITGV